MSEEIDRQNEIMEELSGQRSLEDIQKLYSNMPLRELIRKTLDGLKMPHDTGEYKFARLQVQRMSAPIAAVLIPLIGILILFTIKTDTTEKAINKPVEIYFPEDDETETFRIVTTIRGNSLKNLISIDSPLGKALLHHRVGDRVRVKINETAGYDVVIKSIGDLTDESEDEIRSF